MTRRGIVFLLNCILIIVSCSDSKNENAQILGTNHFDTIKSTLSNYEQQTDSCDNLVNSYYKKFGLIISTYYLIEDSLAIDLNGDSLKDTVFILSPVSIVLSECSELLNLDSSPNRLVVESISNENGVSKVRKVYNQLVSNIGGVLSKYNGMNITPEGFEIRHQSGSKYSWEYSMFFSTENHDSLLLKKIIKICSVDGVEQKFTYVYDNIGVSIYNVNVNDTIDLRCNCDNIWKKIEKSN